MEIQEKGGKLLKKMTGHAIAVLFRMTFGLLLAKLVYFDWWL